MIDYPDEHLSLKVSKDEYSKTYNMYTDGKKSYLNIDPHDYRVSK